jgi:hypothetical protein
MSFGLRFPLRTDASSSFFGSSSVAKVARRTFLVVAIVVGFAMLDALVGVALVLPVRLVRVVVARLRLPSFAPGCEVLLEVIPDALVILVRAVSPEMEAVLGVFWNTIASKTLEGGIHTTGFD